MNKYNKIFNSLTKQQALKAIELIFNEKGVKEMLYYFTVSSMSDPEDASNKLEVTSYVRRMLEAKKLTK